MDKKGVIYLLRCTVNGKGYVGQHCSLAVETKRWAQHINEALRGSEHVIHRAIRKYGFDKFTAEVLWTGPVKKLNEMEIKFIKKMKTSVPAGYNLVLGGKMAAVTPEFCRRVSEGMHKWYKNNPEVRKVLRAHASLAWENGSGWAVSAATWSRSKENVSKLVAGNRTRARARIGTSLTEKHRKHISEGLQDRRNSGYWTEEALKNLAKGAQRNWIERYKKYGPTGRRSKGLHA